MWISSEGRIERGERERERERGTSSREMMHRIIIIIIIIIEEEERKNEESKRKYEKGMDDECNQSNRIRRDRAEGEYARLSSPQEEQISVEGERERDGEIDIYI